jgi:ketosteroid isomerase-like protein
MSQENVELVLGLQLAPDDTDFAQRVRDNKMWTAWTATATRAFHTDFECVQHLFGTEVTFVGMDGFRAFWLDWLAPWASYRIEIERAIDCGDRVVVLVRDFGRREGSPQEIAGDNASVWTVHERQIVRIELFPDHTDALKAVGLEE